MRAINGLRWFIRSFGLWRTVYRFYNAYQFSDMVIHEQMLADTSRVEAYDRALLAHLKPGQVVADLGTGTGILAILAARHGARHVYAVDHSSIITTARRLAEANQIAAISFIQAHSRAFRPDTRVDLIVHEQMGDTLFSEDMVSNLLDWKRRILRPGGIILPGRFELFIEPAQLEESSRVPYLWEHRWAGLDYSVLRPLSRDQTRKHHYRLLRGTDIARILSEPQAVFRWDVNTPDAPETLPKRFCYDRRIVSEGRMDGLAVYFRAHFDDQIMLATYPPAANQSWHVILLRTAATTCHVGDDVRVLLTARDLTDIDSWRWKVGVRSARRQQVNDDPSWAMAHDPG